MHSTEPPKDTSGPLEAIGRFVATAPDDEPARFVLELARIWKDRGGFVAGKPRHSDRYLDDLLRGLGTPIKSLTPKLVGRTHLRPADAVVLIRLFLSHWDYVGDPHSGEIAARSADLYKPMLSEREIEGVCNYIADRISTVGPEFRNGIEPATEVSASGQDTNDLIAAEFQKSAALFTVGAGQTLLVAKPEMALVGFRNVVDRLWRIDEADGQERILVWTMDLGRQDFDDPESRLRFMNVEALISRFKALKRFKESVTEARWNWLQSKAVIVLHDTRSGRPEVPWLPAFDPHHVLFSAIPPRWAGSPEFLALYGNERLHETNYAIFLRRSAEGSLEDGELSNEISSDVGQHYELRYFGNALLKSDELGGRKPRGLQLNAPGRSYVEALGTVYVAATHILRLPSAPVELSIDGMEINPAHAVEKLRHHGFLLLRLDEFMKF
jgi:hypothetical protein